MHLIGNNINTVVAERAHDVRTGIKRTDVADAPMLPPGATVRHVEFGVGQVVGLMASFHGYQTKTMKIPYLKRLSDEISTEYDGKTLHHKRFGKGDVYAYIIVFNKMIIPIYYPSPFTNNSIAVEDIKLYNLYGRRKMKENKYLKWLLIMQSFLPLFFLVIIRCSSKNRGEMILDFILELFHGNLWIIGSALKHPEIYATSLLCFSAIMFVFGLLIYFFFKKSQSFDFREEGRKIIIDADVTENSVTFFVTYIIPLVLGDIDEARGFFSFITIVALLIFLMRNTNLYYQNPFLTILGYRSFYFHFEGEDGIGNIAITRGNFDTSKLIKRKRISDNVYLVYNKN